MPDLSTQTLAIDRQRPTSRRWQASFVFWYKESIVTMLHHPATAYSRSFQSAPAGQRSAPVALWWKPRFVLTLRERGGFSGTSRGVIHSSTAPFILFVSSDLALEAPFWTWNRIEEKRVMCVQQTYQICYRHRLFVWAFHKALLKMGYHPQQLLKYTKLSPAPAP
jgi:hypothetical protein